MSEFTEKVYDYGICEFCGQPIEGFERWLHIRRKDECSTRVAHVDCWEDHLEEMEE